MLNSVSEDLRTALVCETFGDLTTQDKAGVLFTTGDDVIMGYLA
jgi:isopentenyl phosphate kinase